MSATSNLPVILIPVSLMVLGLLAQWTAHRAWNSFINYQTPYVFSNPKRNSLPPLADHVYVVLVDGLRYDRSREMRYLNELRGRGADVVCTVGVPSLSLPGRAVMMTGAWQEIHGQLSNFNARPLPIETLFQAIREQGLRTALGAGRNAQTIFGMDVDERVDVPFGGGHRLGKDMTRGERELHQAAVLARQMIVSKRPNFFLVDFTLTDDVAHDFGAISTEYATAADITDHEIQSLATTIDFSDSVLIVTSDHGHVDRGGHGGDEPDVLTVPWIMAGKGVLSGIALLGRQIDLAPTIAALLGTKIPADNQGLILTDALQLDDSAKVRLLDNLFQEKKNFTDRYLSVVNGTPSTSLTQEPAVKTVTSLEAALNGLDMEAEAAKRGRISQEPAARIAWAILIILLPLAALCVYALRGWINSLDIRSGLLAIVIYWALYFLLFEGSHMAYSFTAVNVEENLGLFFAKDMLFAAAALFLAVAGTGGLMRPRAASSTGSSPGDPGPPRLSDRKFPVRSAYCASAMIVISILIKVCLEYWRYGVFVRWYVPNTHWGFGIYLDLLQLIIVGYIAWLAPVAAWLGSNLFSSGIELPA